ncbi:uncharacterized protein LOC117178338 [Belonocnema kinseyi]|uniref:uncharacterized protein LOC117178338 n=1 Tax=Belonocnema kinseyi TaxID=2817044 RepID=UPI00143DE478|nr:uncharacterized protein LOC117178338 [Belonocnema kinseyi]
MEEAIQLCNLIVDIGSEDMSNHGNVHEAAKRTWANRKRKTFSDSDSNLSEEENEEGLDVDGDYQKEPYSKTLFKKRKTYYGPKKGPEITGVTELATKYKILTAIPAIERQKNGQESHHEEMADDKIDHLIHINKGEFKRLAETLIRNQEGLRMVVLQQLNKNNNADQSWNCADAFSTNAVLSTLPFDSTADVDNFNTLLQNADFKKLTYRAFDSIGGGNVRSTIYGILKRIFSNYLAVSWTWCGRSNKTEGLQAR